MISLNCAEPSVSVVFKCANRRYDGKKVSTHGRISVSIIDVAQILFGEMLFL